jgi:drug/metabolite transporter (DMT)-like permease
MVLLIILLALGMGAFGQLLLKLGATTPVYAPADLAQNLLRMQTMIALVLYVASTGLWIVILSRVALSYAYPLVSLNYVLVTIISAWVLHEDVTAHRWFGLIIIVIGFLVAGTS